MPKASGVAASRAMGLGWALFGAVQGHLSDTLLPAAPSLTAGCNNQRLCAKNRENRSFCARILFKTVPLL
jgi:hypothetical protein